MTANSSPADKKSTGREELRFTAADLVDFALEHYELGRSTDGTAFAIPRDPRVARIARDVRSLRSELTTAVWRERRIAVGRETVATAIETLSGLAADAPVTPIHLRAARVGAAIQLDLGDSTGRYVEVSRYGWEVRNPLEENDPSASRATFRRTAATRALPAPAEGGSPDDLRDLLGLDEDDPRWRLAWGWLVATVFESIPRPILWALGPQGSGKSTRARMILNVIDPADALGREPGKNERDDSTAAAGRYLPSWDNIGNVSSATSDWLCRLVTGVEIGRRELYSDDSLRVATLRRSGVATSIVLPIGLGPDALERLVLLELERVAENLRRTESELWAEFDRRHPRILGALLDDVAGVLAHLGEARETATSLPRMADYALVLRALDIHRDLDELEGFEEAYRRSVGSVLADRATSDPLTAALLKVARRGGGEWSGNAETLLRLIEPDRPDDPRAGWPTSPWSLSTALTKGQETLRAAGLSVARKRRRGERIVVLSLLPRPSEAENVPEVEEHAGEAEVLPLRPPAGLPRRITSAPDLDDLLA